MPTQITMGVTDAVNAQDLNTGQVMPNPYLQGGGDTAQAGATGSGTAPAAKKKAFFDKKTGAILFDDGTHPEQVYDRAQHRRFYKNGDEWLPVPLSETEEKAATAVTVAQGLLMGGGDEFLAAVSNPVSALKAAVGAEPQNGAYYQDLEKARELDTRYADENPWTSAGIKIAAGIPTAIATGGAAASVLKGGAAAIGGVAPKIAATMTGMAETAPTLMGRLGQAALGGSVYGGVAGGLSGEGDLENRAASAGFGAGVGALTGMALQTLSPVARWAYNRINQTPTYWNATTGTLTTEGARAVIQAGGDPARVSREIAEAFARDMRTAADPRAALNNAELNAGLYSPVHLTRGMRTGNPREQMLESRAREGSMGDEAMTVMRASDDETRRGLYQNLEQVRASATNGSPEILPGQGGATAQRRLTEQAERSQAQWRSAYAAAQRAGEASIAPHAFNRIGYQIMHEMGRFHPEAFPKVWRLINQVFRFDGKQNSERLVSALFRAREQLVEMQNLPDERAAATAAKQVFDSAMRSLQEGELSGNQNAVRQWMDAIAERARHGREFERGVVSKIVERDPLSREMKLAAEEVSDRVIGRDVSAKGSLLRDIVAIRNRLGEGTQAWLDFKQDVILRIMDKARGNFMSGRGIDAPPGERSFSASAFAEHIDKLMRERPGLMRLLFTPRELQVLQTVARVGKMTVPAPGGKQLGSSAGWASMIQTTFPGFWNSIRFVMDSAPVRGTIRAASMGGVRARAAGTIPEAPRSYGARNAVASLSAERSAATARDTYAEGTPLQKTAQITGPIPVIGDAMGLAADVEGYRTGRLEPSWRNMAMTAAGVLPFVAGAAMGPMKSGGKAKALPWTSNELRPVRPSNMTAQEAARAAIDSGKYDLSPMQDQMSLLEDVYRGNPRAKVKTVLELAQDQDARAARAGATEALRQKTDTALDHIVHLGTREALEAIARNSDAAQWYRKSVSDAIDQIARLHPEIKTDKVARARFMFGLAMTSNGQDVASNAKYAEWVHDFYSKNGRMPEKVPFGGARKPQIEKALKAWNTLSKEMGGEEKLIEFIGQDHTIGDLKRMGFKVSGENVDIKLPGSVIFGPKVGAGFYSNLMGNFDPLTMDLWFMRTWGRRTGKLHVPMGDDQFQRQLSELRDSLTTRKGAASKMAQFDPSLEGRSPKDLTDEEMVDLAEKIYAEDLRNNFAKFRGKRPAHNMKAQRLIDGMERTLDQPGGGMDRRFQREAYTRILNNLRAEGIDISMADLQALDWYPEKNLFDVRGVGNKRAAPTDYATEFRKLVEERINGKTTPTQ